HREPLPHLRGGERLPGVLHQRDGPLPRRARRRPHRACGAHRLRRPPLRVSCDVMNVRAPEREDFDSLVRLWHDGWRDAHLAIVPEALTRVRTIDSFRERLREGLANVRVAGAPGEPIAFYMIKGDELYQFYVAAVARGTGVAAALMADAET